MRRPHRSLLVATVLVLLVPRGGWAADPGSGSVAEPTATATRSPAHLFGYGRQEIGIGVGYTEGFRFGESTRPLEEVELIYVAPRWGIGISDPMGGDAWYRGNFELLMEGAILIQTEPRDGFGAGLTAMVRYNFLPEGRFIPFVEGGAGLLGIDFDLAHRPGPEAELEGQRDGFNFSLHFGVGSHYFVSDRAALTGEVRYHHISNAETRQPNNGIDSVVFMIGVSIFLN